MENFSAVALGVDESSLTGEPICKKAPNLREFDADATFSQPTLFYEERKLWRDTSIFRVTRIGDATENGQSSSLRHR